jgi:uncharacterized protein YijF (DUF1287 family)
MTLAICAWLALSPAGKIAAGARAQLVEPARYDANYRAIGFPNGDVRKDRGACSDVVVRAFRSAGYDLQVLIHKNRKATRLQTDTNIDHRRVKNQAAFFIKHGRSLTTSTRDPEDWRPGDVVYWLLDNGLDHTGVVIAKRGRSGLPLVVHNLSVVKAEDVLDKWRVVGHYRYP